VAEAAVSSRLESLFGRVLALRVPILVAYALAVPTAAWMGTRIPSEAGIDRLLVATDPDTVATRAFQRIFPEAPLVLLLVEADDPFAPEVLDRTQALESALRAIPGVTPTSALGVFRRTHPAFRPDAAGAAAYRAFTAGTDFFRRQGLVGERFQGMVASFAAGTPAERDRLLAEVDRAAGRIAGGPVVRVRRVGAPYLESWIERESSQAAVRYFPLFALFVVVIALTLYRSVRSLLAILLALGAAVALGVGAARPLGFSFTVVAALVPLTILVTCLSSLVYVHSRFVDQPEDADLEAHQRFALANKFLPVTASTVAAVLGFGALAVSPIRPIREMGIWTATGLALSWLVVFTLFPVLQRVLRTPTARTVPLRSRLYDRIAAAIPGFSRRFRWPLVISALVLAAAGLVALTGVPGRLPPMKVGVDALDYVDPSLDIARDMRFYREHVGGLNVARVWVRTPPGEVTDPRLLAGLDRFTTAAEHEPGVDSVVGPTTFLRLRSYLAGKGDRLPADPEAFGRAAGDLEQLLLTEPALRAFLDVGSLANAQLTVVFERTDEAGYRALEQALRAEWDRTVAAAGLRGVTMQLVGEGLLQAKVGASLVPTLAESFALTAVLILAVFLVVFRSGTARLMAMIPSVFAILVTFLGMRLTGVALNVATILIATTVLGTTENDQIHFFHHLAEGEGGLEAALRHTLRVAGRAIAFATLINSAGFLALALSGFPPLRQFGVVTAAAFLLAMLADFTALPAALWMGRRAPSGPSSRRPA
jgi:predicted RND superfamily exporter protein